MIWGYPRVRKASFFLWNCDNSVPFRFGMALIQVCQDDQNGCHQSWGILDMRSPCYGRTIEHVVGGICLDKQNSLIARDFKAQNVIKRTIPSSINRDPCNTWAFCKLPRWSRKQCRHGSKTHKKFRELAGELSNQSVEDFWVGCWVNNPFSHLISWSTELRS